MLPEMVFADCMDQRTASYRLFRDLRSERDDAQADLAEAKSPLVVAQMQPAIVQAELARSEGQQ